jgi:hypothetical protein
MAVFEDQPLWSRQVHQPRGKVQAPTGVIKNLTSDFYESRSRTSRKSEPDSTRHINRYEEVIGSDLVELVDQANARVEPITASLHYLGLLGAQFPDQQKTVASRLHKIRLGKVVTQHSRVQSAQVQGGIRRFGYACKRRKAPHINENSEYLAGLPTRCRELVD